MRSLADAVPLIDAIAPEHLELIAADAESLIGRIRNAGAIFIGGHTPEAIGDYVGGSNHVLPTARSARFSSGLSVLDFMKRTSILKCGPEQLAALGPAAIALGEAEGLDAHARSVAIRTNKQMSGAGQRRKARGDHARRELDRAVRSRYRARARGRDLRPDRAEFVRAGRTTTAGPTRCISAWRRTGWSSTSASPTARR